MNKTTYKVNKMMANDLLEAEYFINTMGIETRKVDNDDEFRSMGEIVKDIFTVCKNNPTLINDTEKFLLTNPSTSDESIEFLKKYNLGGVICIKNH